MLPHDVAKLLVDRVYRALTLDTHQAVDFLLNALLSLLKLLEVGREAGPERLVGQIVLDGVGKHKVTVSQALHERGSTQTVGTVVREVALADGKQAGDSGLQLVVYPDTTHRIVDSGEDHHRIVVLHAVDLLGQLTGIHVGNLLVHVEEVAVTLQNLVDAQTVDRLREVEEYSQTGIVYTEALVAALLGST